MWNTVLLKFTVNHDCGELSRFQNFTIISFMTENGLVSRDSIVEPNEARTEDLRVVHTQRYLKSLRVISAFVYVVRFILLKTILLESVYIF